MWDTCLKKKLFNFIPMVTNRKITKKTAITKADNAVIIIKTKVAAKESLFAEKVKEMNRLLAKTKLMKQ